MAAYRCHEDHILIAIAELQYDQNAPLEECRLQAALEAMRAGDTLPPIVLTRGNVFLTDGRHRLEAARQLGLTHVPVRFETSRTAELVMQAAAKFAVVAALSQ